MKFFYCCCCTSCIWVIVRGHSLQVAFLFLLRCWLMTIWFPLINSHVLLGWLILLVRDFVTNCYLCCIWQTILCSVSMCICFSHWLRLQHSVTLWTFRHWMLAYLFTFQQVQKAEVTRLEWIRMCSVAGPGWTQQTRRAHNSPRPPSQLRNWHPSHSIPSRLITSTSWFVCLFLYSKCWRVWLEMSRSLKLLAVFAIISVWDYVGYVCLQELQQNVEEFQRESKAALEGPHMPSMTKLKQLIYQGQNLGVELTECKPLKWVTS